VPIVEVPLKAMVDDADRATVRSKPIPLVLHWKWRRGSLFDGMVHRSSKKQGHDLDTRLAHCYSSRHGWLIEIDSLRGRASSRARCIVTGVDMLANLAAIERDP
jgi:hypothetical protein